MYVQVDPLLLLTETLPSSPTTTKVDPFCARPKGTSLPPTGHPPVVKLAITVQVTPSVLEATEKRSPINTNLLPVHNMVVAKLPSVAHAVDAMLDWNVHAEPLLLVAVPTELFPAMAKTEPEYAITVTLAVVPHDVALRPSWYTHEEPGPELAGAQALNLSANIKQHSRSEPRRSWFRLSTKPAQ